MDVIITWLRRIQKRSGTHVFHDLPRSLDSEIGDPLRVEMKIEAVAVVALPSRRVPGFAATTQSASPGKTSVTTLLLLLHLPEQIRASTEQRTSV